MSEGGRRWESQEQSQEQSEQPWEQEEEPSCPQHACEGEGSGE